MHKNAQHVFKIYQNMIVAYCSILNHMVARICSKNTHSCTNAVVFQTSFTSFAMVLLPKVQHPQWPLQRAVIESLDASELLEVPIAFWKDVQNSLPDQLSVMWLPGTQNSLEEMVRNLPKGFEDQQAFWKFGTSLCTREERMLITNEDPPQKMQESARIYFVEKMTAFQRSRIWTCDCTRAFSNL